MTSNNKAEGGGGPGWPASDSRLLRVQRNGSPLEEMLTSIPTNNSDNHDDLPPRKRLNLIVPPVPGLSRSSSLDGSSSVSPRLHVSLNHKRESFMQQDIPVKSSRFMLSRPACASTAARRTLRRTGRCPSSSIIHALANRDLGLHGQVEQDLYRLAERITSCAERTRTRFVHLTAEAKCTIAVTMSPQNDDLVVSTHGGDHTVKLSSFTTGRVERSLARHPRTPWAVAIHPLNPSLVASGCLNGKVCVWKDGHLYREMDLGVEIIMSLAFHVTSHQNLLYIAWGTTVWSWDYSLESNLPQRILDRKGRVQCVCFSAGNAMLTAEMLGPLQNLSRIFLWRPREQMTRTTNIPGRFPQGEDDESYGADEETAFGSSPWVLPVEQASIGVSSPSSVSAATVDPNELAGVRVLADVVLYSDGGMSVSKCGRFICAIQSLTPSVAFSPANPMRCQLVVVSLQPRAIGSILRSIVLDGITSAGLTSVKFSPTDEHIVCGYGVAGRPFLQLAESNGPAEKYCLAVFSNYARNGDQLKLEAVKTSHTDDVNVAVFHPSPGLGVLYGTRQGPLRMWEKDGQDAS